MIRGVIFVVIVYSIVKEEFLFELEMYRGKVGWLGCGKGLLLEVFEWYGESSFDLC